MNRILFSLCICTAALSGSAQEKPLTIKPNFIHKLGGHWGVGTTHQGVIPIEKHMVDRDIRRLPIKDIAALLDAEAIEVIRMSDGTYRLAKTGKLNGGGPLAGQVAYWTTKSICYGGAIAAVLWSIKEQSDKQEAPAIVKNTASFAGGALVKNAFSAPELAQYSQCALPFSPGAVTTGIAIGISSTEGGGEAAATLALGSMTVLGGATETVTFVEKASAFMGALFTAIPWLP